MIAPRLVPLLAALLLTALAACDAEQSAPRERPDFGLGLPALPDGSFAPPPDAAPWEIDAGPNDRMDAEAPPPDAAPEIDAAQFDVIPFDIETRVGNRRTVAGLENNITCQVLDQTGEPIDGARTRVEIFPDSGWEATEGGAVGVIARDYRVVCASASLGLRDDDPAIWTVVPDNPARVVTRLTETDLEAGGTTTVSCEAFDEFGNPLELGLEQFDVDVVPPAPNLDRGRDGELTMFDAGTFDVTCRLPGAEASPGVTVEVRSALPANIALSLEPEQGVYRVGQVIEMVAIVTDRFDNPLPEAPLVFDTEPDLPMFGSGRFRADPEGRYTLAVAVDGPTEGGVVLEAQRDILVDFGGPGIACDSPAFGAAIALPPGGGHVLEGQVGDVAGVAEVRVDGEIAALDANGNWSLDVPVRWGLNVHDVVAVDGEGQEASTFCAYFASDVFAPEDISVVDAILLRMAQGTLDDGEPDAPLRSIADVLRRVVNSQGLRTTVNDAALAQNPIVPNECRARVLGVCLFRLGVEYQGIEFRDRHTLALTLVDGGLRARASIRGTNVFARLRGTLGNRARIWAEHLTIDLTFNVNRRFDGSPSVSLRSVNEVSVGDLDSDFSGFITGAILELVFWAFEGLIRDTITGAIRDFLTDNINATLEDLLGNIDIGALSQGFDVPNPIGGEAIRLTVSPTLSTISLEPDRMLIGIETKVDGPARIAARSPGVPVPPGPVRAPLPGDRGIGAGVSLIVLNQVLHRLWRAGFFALGDGAVANLVGGDLPAGTEVSLELPSAPAVIGGVEDDGAATVRVFLGPATAGVVYPQIWVEPFRVTLATEVSATVRLLQGRDVSFEGVTIDNLWLSLGGATVSPQSRMILEDTLRRVLQSLVDSALNDGFPEIPIPEFVIPQSLGQFDLPVGVGLGLRDAGLQSTEAHWMIFGNFGE